MKRINLIYLCFCSICSSIGMAFGQAELLETITGPENNFALGQNVQISADGKKIVVSGYGTTKNGITLFESINGNWEQQSFLAPSITQNKPSIYTVAMSKDGANIVVGTLLNNIEEDFGYVSVYREINDSWEQVGNALVGENAQEFFGSSVAISDDGNRIVIGARLNSKNRIHNGRVAVYEFDGNDWGQLGSSLYGIHQGFKMGSAVSISGNGNLLFLGTNSGYRPNSFNPKYFQGFIEIFELRNGDWSRLYNESGEKFSQLGYSVAIANNGTFLAAGATEFKRGGGYVSIINYQDNTVTPIAKIDGGSGQYMGSSLAFSANGNRIAIGSKDAIHDEQQYGDVSIYEYVGDKFLLLERLVGDATKLNFGTSLDISADGNTLVVGALDYDFGVSGSETGSISVYDLSTLEIPEETAEYNFITPVLIPSPASTTISCVNCNDVTEFYFFNTIGKNVFHYKGEFPSVLDVSLLQSGMYYAFFYSKTNDMAVTKFIID